MEKEVEEEGEECGGWEEKEEQKIVFFGVYSRFFLRGGGEVRLWFERLSKFDDFKTKLPKFYDRNSKSSNKLEKIKTI